MYYSMYMVSNASEDFTELVVSPCAGNPVLLASPYTLHPNAGDESSYEVRYESVSGRELRFSLSGVGASMDKTIWSINIDAPNENMYELYPSNSHYRPVQSYDSVEVKKLTDSEKKSDSNAKFAVEFSYFDLAVKPEDPEIKNGEIRYYLYGFENRDETYATACSVTYNGKSLYHNNVTGVDYIVRSKNAETTLRILANNKDVNLGKIERVYVVAKYVIADGTQWSSYSSYADVKGTSSGLEWWGILLIVLLVLLVFVGVGFGVYFLIRHKRKQGEYLMDVQNDDEMQQESSNAAMAAKFIS